METNNRRPQRNVDGIFLGALLVVAGCIRLLFGSGLLLRLTGWGPFTYSAVYQLIFSWPMLLVVLGLWALVRRHGWLGLILLAAGTILSVPNMVPLFSDSNTALDVRAIQGLLGYLLLAIVGICIIVRSVRGPRKRSCRTGEGPREYVSRYSNVNRSRDNQNRIHYDFVFSGTEEVYLEPVFYGGSIKTTFGGVSLDLRRTTLPEGTTYLDLNNVFGGVTLLVPEDWRVEILMQNVLGGFDDERVKFNQVEAADRKLVITGKCVFGGGEVK